MARWLGAARCRSPVLKRDDGSWRQPRASGLEGDQNAYADTDAGVGREACKGGCWNGSMGELDGSLLRPSLSLSLNDPLIVIHWSSATLSLQPPNHFLPA